MRELVKKFEKEMSEKEVWEVERRKAKEKKRELELELNPEVESFKRSELLEKYTVRILFE